MSDKPRKTVTLSNEAKRILDEEDNASAVVTDLVEQYGRTGDRGTAGLRLQRKHKAKELEETLEKAERLESELEDIDELIREFEADENAEWEEAREVLEDVPKESDNPAIQNWASRLGVTPEELIRELS